jgi:O-antigen ligase
MIGLRGQSEVDRSLASFLRTGKLVAEKRLLIHLKRFFKCKSGVDVFIAQCLIFVVVISMTRAFALTNLAEVILWLMFLFRENLRSQFVESLRDPRVSSTMIFWCYVGLSIFWSKAGLLAGFEDWVSWRKLLLVPFCFVLFKTQESKIALKAIFLITCLWYLIFVWGGYYNILSVSRDPIALIENHATQGIFFGMAAVLMYSVLSKNKSISTMGKVLSVIFIGGCLAATFGISSGRSGYLFTSVAFGYLILSEPDKRLRLYGILSCFAVAALVLAFSDVVVVRLITGWTELLVAFDSETKQAHSMSIRLVMWLNTLDMIYAHPLFGTGAGGFSQGYADQVSVAAGWRGLVSDDPHQQYLHIAAEYGVVGLSLFIISLSLWLKYSFLRTDINQRIAMAVLIATIANSFANGHFATFVEGRLVWIFLAALVASIPPLEQRSIER